MGLSRVALIFDNQARPETTGLYCRRALGQLLEVEHFLPSELASVPAGAFDLYLAIDDGLRYPMPAHLRPSAWWAIDTHLDFAWRRAKAAQFDRVFAAQRDGADALRAEGFVAEWLPLACDLQLHCAQAAVKEFDVCFIGNLFPGPRQELVRLIQNHFPRTLVDRRYFRDMALAYSASRMVFNRSLRNDVNMRVFEALASGSLLVTNDLAENGQSDLFSDGVHLAAYREADDLLETLHFYRSRDALRERIAAAGRAEVLAKHTYVQRMRRILEVADSQLRRSNAPTSAARFAPADSDFDRAVCSAPASDASVQATHVQDASYFEFARPELLELIPATARRVLEIGCGAGRLGESLKRRQPAEVLGIEWDATAAARAATRLDQVLVGDVELLPLDFPPSRFDCVVCGDVLEHLNDPAVLLGRIRQWLAPSGFLVASVPNVRHHSVVAALLEGHFCYEPAGLLDDTHQQFFTRRDLERLFKSAGYAVAMLRFVPGAGFDEWRTAGRPGDLRLGPLELHGLSPEEAEEFFAYQYLVCAAPLAEPERR